MEAGPGLAQDTKNMAYKQGILHTVSGIVNEIRILQYMQHELNKDLLLRGFQEYGVLDDVQMWRDI